MSTESAPVRPVSGRRMVLRDVTVDRTRLRVATWPGERSGPPLLMFNGIGASVELLAPLADAIGERVEVVCFDVPGTGGSAPRRTPYRMCMLARLTGLLLDQLGYGRVDVLGVSWGGAPAQQFAVQNPRRCRRLVLAATSTGSIMVPPRPSVLARFLTPRRHNDAAYRERVAGEIYGGKARDGGGGHHFRRTSRIGYLHQELALAGWTSLPFLPLIRQPTLVLAGDDDPVVRPVNARILAAGLPDARLRTFDDGHLFLISSADEAGPVVRDFLLEA